jgi:peptide chain release factor 2
MVKDLRTKYETSDVNAVMDGHIQPFIEAWLQMQASGAPRASADAEKDDCE